MSWLDRQSFLGAESDTILAGLTIGLVGLGGGGSHVAQQLAHVGVGGFVIVDDDCIDESNLNRLVGGTIQDVQIGSSKVDIAARLIRSVNPNARIEKHKKRWQEASDSLKSCDVVIAGIDNVRSKAELDAFTKRFMMPLIDMGMDVSVLKNDQFLISGQVVLTGPGEPCLRCLGIVTDDAIAREAARYGAAGGRPQVVWPNGLLGSIAVGLLVQLVTPWNGQLTTSAFIEYDGNTHATRDSHRLRWCRENPCTHFLSDEVGDPIFDRRELGKVRTYSTIDEPSVTLGPNTTIWTALQEWFSKRVEYFTRFWRNW